MTKAQVQKEAILTIINELSKHVYRQGHIDGRCGTDNQETIVEYEKIAKKYIDGVMR